MSQEEPTKSFDIISVGTIYLDINSPNFPFQLNIPPGQTVGGSYILKPGGSAMNLARVAAFLGLKPVIIGKIGQDALGKIINQSLVESGITPSLIKSGAVQTNLGLNFTNPQGQTIMATVGTANQDLSPDEILIQLKANLSHTKFLYLGGYFKVKHLIPHYPEIINLAKSTSTKILLDHGETTNIATGDERLALISIMKDIDYYLPNQAEFLDLWQAQDINLALKKARNSTPATIVVKQAEQGAIGSTAQSQETVHQPAYPVAPISTVGAGDSFNAGFIKALTLQKTLPEAIKFANATAAQAISQKTLPTTETIEKFIQNQA